MASPVEQIAAVCRASLRSSLDTTAQLVREESTPSDSLLARMTDALTGVVASNFGPATYDPLARLYTTIEEVQPSLIDKCEHMTMYYFARALGVVLEEAVRQKAEILAELDKYRAGGYGREEYGSKEKDKEEEKKEEGAEYGSQKKEYGNEEKKEEEKGEEGKEEEKKEEKEEEEYGSEEQSTVAVRGSCSLETCLSTSFVSRSLSSSSACSLSVPVSRHISPLPPPTCDDLPEEWHGRSAKEQQCLITIKGVSPTLGREELLSFLEMMGPVAELRLYPEWDGWAPGFGVCRYESEEGVSAALARLHLKKIFGTRLFMARVRVVTATATREVVSATRADGDATGADAAPSPPPPRDTPSPPIVDTDTVSQSDSDEEETTATRVYDASAWYADDEVD